MRFMRHSRGHAPGAVLLRKKRRRVGGSTARRDPRCTPPQLSAIARAAWIGDAPLAARTIRSKVTRRPRVARASRRKASGPSNEAAATVRSTPATHHRRQGGAIRRTRLAAPPNAGKAGYPRSGRHGCTWTMSSSTRARPDQQHGLASESICATLPSGERPPEVSGRNLTYDPWLAGRHRDSVRARRKRAVQL